MARIKDVEDQEAMVNRAEEEKTTDVTSRNPKWGFCVVRITTAIVGTGVLSLPYAMSQLGWVPGVAALLILWLLTLKTLWQMVEMHEMVPEKRFNEYNELCEHIIGEKLGLYIVVSPQLIVEVGINIVYMIIGGKSLKKFLDVVCKDNCKDIKFTYFIMIFASVHFVISHFVNTDSILGMSMVAAAMSLSYSTIAWSASLKNGVLPGVQYGYKGKTNMANVFNFFSALGTVGFAYAGHNVVLEIQATIPSTPEKPSKGPMWRLVIVAYIVAAVCYFPVALIGYWTYGNAVSDNILITLENPKWLIAMGNLFLVVHVICSYQIQAMSVVDKIENVLVKKFKFGPSFTLGFLTRSLYVALTMFIAICFPFFDELLGFLGGFHFALRAIIVALTKLQAMIFRKIAFSSELQ
ncbi:hypothetical protein L2E82_44480 [Cichorium intybus]|uniref:Uncharacterized protein n=1 Tax=Cichorium intybus TaxID=13427 RepID=A0ACB8ZQ90_CICIN|nr:hypothetical protein L2E82_44480 [Cichorium intybus]